MNIYKKIDPRLMTAISFVRKGDVIADIGTDHGYIPIYLLTEKIIDFAYATDINKKPLDKAKNNSIKAEVNERIIFSQCDGLAFISNGEMNEEHPVNDVIICGMGGELIAKIIDSSTYTRENNIRLILQPMTMSDKLRLYLIQNGYTIIDEKLCESMDKVYTVICAEYTGVSEKYSDIELIIGKKIIENKPLLMQKILTSNRKKYQTIISGLKTGGYDCSKEEIILNEIDVMLNEFKENSVL